MHPIVVGLNYQTTPIELRERAAFSPEKTRAAIRQLSAEGVLEETVILSTCHRSEIYGVAGAGGDAVHALKSFVCDFHRIDPGEVHDCFYDHADAEAARHLFRVAASLDSMVLGEPHILGQVRGAFLLAWENRTTGLMLNHLFQKASRVGKRVRAHTEIGRRPVSVGSVAVELAARMFGRVQQCSALVLGAGEMSQVTVKSLALRGVERITVANRSWESARALAERFGGTAVPWERLPVELISSDLVISSIQADQYVLGRELIEQTMAERNHRPLLLIDLGRPRNIQPEAGELYNVFLYNLDHLQDVADDDRRERMKEVPEAERIIAEEVRSFMRWQARLCLIPTVKSLRHKVDCIREAELEAHLRKLEPISERDRRIVTAMSHAIVNKILHEPTVRLKESARGEHLDTIRHLFDLGPEE